MFGASFPFRIQEKAYIKNFEGGGLLGALKFFMLNFFACFFFCSHDPSQKISSYQGPKPKGPGKKKQHKHKLFGPDFPRTFLTLTPGCPGVKKFLPITGAAEKRPFLAQTSTIFGSDVHDPKGSPKTLRKKCLR